MFYHTRYAQCQFEKNSKNRQLQVVEQDLSAAMECRDSAALNRAIQVSTFSLPVWFHPFRFLLLSSYVLFVNVLKNVLPVRSLNEAASSLNKSNLCYTQTS